MQLAYDTVHHWFTKENQSHGTQIKSDPISWTINHLRQCGLIFLLIPILYGVIFSDTMINSDCKHPGVATISKSTVISSSQ